MGEFAYDEPTSLSRVLALADDLSGAAETAAALLPAFGTGELRLSGTRPEHRYAHTAQAVVSNLVVVDLDSRHGPAEPTAAAVDHALRDRGARSAHTFIKIDSLLRGNVAATLSAAGPVVFAPALPTAGRTVRGGVLHLRGVALHETAAWRAEPAAPPTGIAELLAPGPCRHVPLDAVRSPDLPAALRASLAAAEIPLCDGETDSDLDAVVAATLALGSATAGVRLAGSGALAAALGRALPPHASATAPAPNSAHGLLFVVGTAERTAREQVRRLVAAGARQVPLDASALLGGEADAGRITGALRRAPVVLTVDAPDGVDPAQSRALVQGLADTARRAVAAADRPVDLVLTGGETARRVLDALGVPALAPLAQIHHGAVHSRAPGGTSVVTRPGSFGEADSLVRIAEHLRPPTEG
ncbi:four-carbon acid sugar kinase family protein [Saccharopolyspora sp. NFXS83]|uniref:four-carbon acid sugar kinase family protein n=1 Tax=Saccharopolyspora sp. NFXS83 TaxID=2993560 RepID=UPI00224A9BB4|nr:four-carbon acid sugar kinase family protein [Saccharopolyspora sp. NFXS83]MCX2730142.1 four-carbon acid sugar kinase family protein [Saccharopolyspora sp. NFXS83]